MTTSSAPKVVFIDIDGTICSEERTFERSLATPLPGAREKIQAWYDAGHTIVFWTARGWEQYRMTHDWLTRHSFPFHQLMMGKPIVSVFIDDRAHRFAGWDKDYGV